MTLSSQDFFDRALYRKTWQHWISDNITVPVDVYFAIAFVDERVLMIDTEGNLLFHVEDIEVEKGSYFEQYRQYYGMYQNPDTIPPLKMA